MSNTIQVPPSDQEAENRILVGIARNPDLLQIAASSGINENAFYLAKHKEVFKAIGRLSGLGETIDFRSIKSEMERIGKWEAGIFNNSFDYIGEGDFEAHCRRIVRFSDARRMISALHESTSRLYKMADVDGEIQRIETEFAKMASLQTACELRETQEIADEFLDNLEKRISNPGLMGISSGLSELDAIINGWQAPRMYIVAARPSMGKSDVAINMIIAAAMQDIKSGVLGLEMGDVEMFQRAVSYVSGMRKDDLEKGTAEAVARMKEIIEAVGKLVKSGVMIEDAGSSSINQIITKAARMVRKGAKLIAIDYLGLVDTEGKDEVKELGEIARKIKMKICKEMKVPVILLHQLSRSVESRGGDKRPIMSDLRGSGKIEEHADVIMMLYRPEYYGFMTDDEGSSTQGLMEIIINKNRHGATGTVKVAYTPRTGQIRDWGMFHNGLTPLSIL